MHIRPINAVEVKLIIFIIMKTVLNKNVQRRPKNAKEQDTLRKQINECVSYTKREAQLSPSDRAMHLVSSNLANCHATVQKLLIRQVLTKLMA